MADPIQKPKPWNLPKSSPEYRAWYAILEWCQDDPKEALTPPRLGEPLHEHYPRLMLIVAKQIQDAVNDYKRSTLGHPADRLAQ